MDAFCAKCGVEYREGDAFCAKCGAPRVTGGARRVSFDDDARTSSTPRPASGGGGGKGIAVTSLVIAAIGIGAFVVFGNACEDLEGHVAVSGGPQPAFTFTPTGCASMQPYGHFGANLHGKGPNDGGTYVTVDPIHGASVDVEIPGSCRNANGTDCTLIHVQREKCRTWDPHVENSNTSVNDVTLVQGHLSLDCTLDDGTHVVANVKFSGC